MPSCYHLMTHLEIASHVFLLKGTCADCRWESIGRRGFSWPKATERVVQGRLEGDLGLLRSVKVWLIACVVFVWERGAETCLTLDVPIGQARILKVKVTDLGSSKLECSLKLLKNFSSGETQGTVQNAEITYGAHFFAEKLLNFFA